MDTVQVQSSPDASTSNLTPAPPPPSTNAAAPSNLPIRAADYHSEEEEETDDEGLLLNEKKSRPRALSLQFDFTRLDLSSSVDASTAPRGAPAEPISLLAGIALTVGMQIGSGIFSSPGVVARETGSVGGALLLWLLAGMLSWAGASSFTELGSALPMNGGAQAYLAAAFGPRLGYCFSFTAVTALKPGSQAIISVIFGEYVCRLLYHSSSARDVPAIAIKVAGLLVLLVVSLLQAWSAKAGTRAQTVLTIFKVFAIVLVFIGGLVWLGLGRAASSFTFAGSSTQATSYALALFSALWTYEGWDQACYVTKDIAPGILPTIINSSMGLVIGLFLSANISYFLVLPFATATASSTIGLDFGREIAGSVGGVIFALIVGLSCLGALNGSLYTSSRLIVAAGEQGFLPKLFSKYNERQSTPVNGILLSSSLSALFILLGDFTHLTLFYGVCAWTWNLLAVVGLLVLRVREPALKRPYRTFLATPILFASTALFLITLSCFSKPWESLAAFGFCTAGVVPYHFQMMRSKAEEERNVGLEMT